MSEKVMNSKIRSIIFCATYSVLSLPVSAYNLLDKTDLSGQVSLGGDYVDNKQVEARVFGVTGYLNLLTKLTPTFEIDISAGATMESGSNNSFIVDEFAPRRQVRLKRAYLKWSPVSYFSVKTGAINQRDYNAPLLLTNSAFLGAQEQISYAFSDSHNIYFRLQQAIPNNLNLTQRIGIVEDGTPSFLMETIGVDFDGDVLAFKGHVSHWTYDSLSTGAAFQSQFLGNSVSGGSQLNSDFIYRYSGYTASSSLRVHISDSFGLKASGQYLYNDKAPEGRNKGQLLKGALILGNWQPSFLFFRNESDASPAFYNSAFVSHNNHEGYSVELKYTDPYDKNEDKIEAFINYVDSSPIQFNAFQSDTKKVNFSIKFPFEIK